MYYYLTVYSIGVIEDTAALTSITKTRVKGPKKKARPTKSSAITTLDPFEVASGRFFWECRGSVEGVWRFRIQ